MISSLSCKYYVSARLDKAPGGETHQMTLHLADLYLDGGQGLAEELSLLDDGCRCRRGRRGRRGHRVERRGRWSSTWCVGLVGLRCQRHPFTP